MLYLTFFQQINVNIMGMKEMNKLKSEVDSLKMKINEFEKKDTCLDEHSVLNIMK